MKFVFLCAEPADYLLRCINELASKNNVIVFHYPVSGNAPFDLATYYNIQFIEFTHTMEAKTIINTIGDDLHAIITAGWNNQTYLFVNRHFRKKGIMTVMMSDTPWLGTIRQRIFSVIAPIVLKRIFTHIWVPGERQISYAKKLGFKPGEILNYLYCANDIFLSSSNNLERFEDLNKTIVFAGRLVSYKGILEICQAYISLHRSGFTNWRLKVVGNGSLKETLSKEFPEIEIISFVQPNDLLNVFERSHCFILASSQENWGVAVHEASGCGLPLLLTKGVGAASTFLEDQVNGFVIESRTVEDVRNALAELFKLNSENLIEMSKISKEKSRFITRDRWISELTEHIESFYNN